MDRLQKGSPEWEMEWNRLNELLIEWKSNSNNRELIDQIGLSLEKVGIIIGGNE
jgi:hypothetical protein